MADAILEGREGLNAAALETKKESTAEETVEVSSDEDKPSEELVDDSDDSEDEE
jgi:small subunit ribosomal protein S2